MIKTSPIPFTKNMEKKSWRSGEGREKEIKKGMGRRERKEKYGGAKERRREINKKRKGKKR